MVGNRNWTWLIALLLGFSVACGSDDPVEGGNDNQPNQNNDTEKEDPELELSGDDPMSWTLEINQSDTADFEVANTGERELDFEIDTDGEWLDFTPGSGELEGDESTTIDVEATCSDDVGEYSATVVVDSNGGTEEFGAELDCQPPAPGQLEVHIEGLPDTEDADVSIEGPDGFSEQLSETETFGEVDVGEYEITAYEVGDDAVYTPDPEVQTTEVSSEETAAVTVTYDPVPGDVLISVEGLPMGLEPTLTLVRDGDEWDVPDNGLVQDLEPGSYTVVADDVEDPDGDETYQASDTAAYVKSDEVTDVTVTYLVDVGYLEVEVGGLPEGTPHDIEVVAQSDGTSTTLPQTGSLTLEPDTYDLNADDVEVGFVTYDPSGDATVEIQEGETTDASIHYDLVDAELEVTLEGLEGVSAPVAVEFIGDEETKTVTDSESISLFPDEYDVEPEDVQDGLETYEADSTSIELYSGSNGELVIDYSLIKASLDIDLTGDLSEGEANIDVTSTDGYSENYDGSVELDNLDPGEYTVTVHNVDDGPATYEASGSDDFTLKSGDEESVTADYELMTVDIIVAIDEYGDVDYEFELTGTDGFDETISGSASFSDEMPGNYEISLVDAEDDGYGNEPHIDVDPESFTVTSDDGHQQIDIEVRAANIVTTETDDASLRGSLRYVIDDVQQGTQIGFADNISELVLSEGVFEIDSSLEIAADDTDPVVIDADDASRIFYVQNEGDLALENLMLTNGHAAGDEESDGGGAVRIVDEGRLEAQSVAFEHNYAEYAGGAVLVRDDGQFIARQIVMKDNQSELWGAAIQTLGGTDEFSEVYVRRSLFQDNEANGDGGAIDGFALDGVIELEQSTFVGNISGGLAAAIVIYSGTAVIEGVTVSGNFNDNVDNDEVGGLYAHLSTDVTLRGTIIAGNDEQDLGGSADSFDSTGFNIIGDDSAVENDIDWQDTDEVAVANPGLQSLSDNGGPTPTMRLGSGSPARLIMPSEDCLDGQLDWSYDQRGYHRPAGAFCSAGAYEVDADLETFEHADMAANTYEQGSFVGDNDVEWHYEETRRSGVQSGSIDGTSVVLHYSPAGSIRTEQLTDGISSLSMQLGHAFTGPGDRQVEVFVDGESVGTSEPFDDSDDDGIPGGAPVHHFAVEDIDVSGDFDIEIVSIGDGQILVDNVSWE